MSSLPASILAFRIILSLVVPYNSPDFFLTFLHMPVLLWLLTDKSGLFSPHPLIPISIPALSGWRMSLWHNLYIPSLEDKVQFFLLQSPKMYRAISVMNCQTIAFSSLLTRDFAFRFLTCDLHISKWPFQTLEKLNKMWKEVKVKAQESVIMTLKSWPHCSASQEKHIKTGTPHIFNIL